jgi:hypothetical protein
MDRISAIKEIRAIVRTLPTAVLQQYADQLPVGVAEAARDFRSLFDLTKGQIDPITSSNVSVPWELHQLIKERNVEQNNKGVLSTKGDQ